MCGEAIEERQANRDWIPYRVIRMALRWSGESRPGGRSYNKKSGGQKIRYGISTAVAVHSVAPSLFVRLMDSYGSSIAVVIHFLDHPLSTRFIALTDVLLTQALLSVIDNVCVNMNDGDMNYYR